MKKDVKEKPKGGGRPPKLGEEDLPKLHEFLEKRPYWTKPKNLSSLA